MPQASACHSSAKAEGLPTFGGHKQSAHTPDAPRVSTVCEPEGSAPPLTHPARPSFPFEPLPPGPGAALHMGQAQLCTHGLHMRRGEGPTQLGRWHVRRPDHLPRTPTISASLSRAPQTRGPGPHLHRDG